MKKSTRQSNNNKTNSDHILSSSPKKEDHDVEKSLRPSRMSNVIGRSAECDSLQILIDAALSRKESVDHILFHGPPGLGKTTFAHVVANEMKSNIRVTSGPAIERQGDLAAILTNLRPKDVLFIDEIHRLNRGVEEILYPAMEDYKLDIVVGKGPSARSIRLKLPRFTLIGATTRVSLISSPLRDRFGFIQRLDYFTEDSLSDIVLRAAELSKVKISQNGTRAVAKRSRGTARVALRLFRRVRDYCQVRHKGSTIDGKIADLALSSLGVDVLGLDDLDRKILSVIVEKFDGGPVGLSTIAAAVSEEPDTISEVYEPFLIQRGLIKRTPRGRMATKMAFKHLGLDVSKQKTLLSNG
ncbi:MAG: Holliday junction branch migration DNA helicase RuvB [Patescibacteria group bacterium]|nr:Holliday junction branch migration DNA helicase RuvB [Patescibacteria group bacterium]